MSERPIVTIEQQIAAMRTALEKFRSGELLPRPAGGFAQVTASGDVVVVNECAPYGPGDWQWWALGCYLLPSK